MVINILLFSLIIAIVCEGCPSGKFGKNCEQYCKYPHCFCTSHLDCLLCEAGYYNTSDYCRLSCITHTCTCTNRYNCLSCKDGSYGLENNCEHSCPTGCDGSACFNNGTCHTCKPYLAGGKCDSCIEGQYGPNCSLQCSQGCAKNVCNSQDGTCNCKKYFHGEKCDSCVKGNYGKNCSLQCNYGCEENICNLRDGSCNCREYYSGEQCKNCITDRYGEDCSKPCSIGCLENTCSPTDGKCYCRDIYTGDKCDVCEDGRYGDHCLNNIESRRPNTLDKFPTAALTGGVIGAVVVFVAAVVITIITIIARRRLSQREAQGHSDEQDNTNPGGEATRPGQYETLNNSRMEDNHRSDTYTRLVTTGHAELTGSVSPDNITMNILGSDIVQPEPYQTLNATVLNESNRNDNYTMLLVSGDAGITKSCNSESIQINHPTNNPECHSYANLMIK